MIELSHIRKVYGGTNTVEALKDISLTVQEGEIYGIIGQSGAGKSTLIRCINMLERPTEGSVKVDGKELMDLNERDLREERKNMGMIFQHFNLLSSRTVYDNVAFPLELQGMSKEQIKERVVPLLELVKLDDRMNNYPAQLSGGQKQRVGIARALASQPKVLLCDEATSALDPQTTKSILELLKDINTKLQLTIVLITHEMQVIKEICDKVAVIEGGVIIEQGTVVDVFTAPQQQTTREFVSSIISTTLPEEVRANMTIFDAPQPHTSPLLHLSFAGNVTEEPIVGSLVKKYDVNVSILFGRVDYIQGIPFGSLIVTVEGTDTQVSEALAHVENLPIGSEVIGYVPTNN